MIAFMFPGQGSQRVGMGRDLASAFHRVRRTFEEADDVLGVSISKLCFEGPESELRQTVNTQPAVLTVSVAILREIERTAGIAPDAVTGHSLGEYAALVCAGAIEFADALRVVRCRGALMQQAVPEGTGAMAAILDLDGEAVVELCAEAAHGRVLNPASFNAPQQTVVSGHADAVGLASQLAAERGGRSVPLNVGGPFHCPLMEPAARGLAEELNGLRVSNPRIPVISTVNAQAHADAHVIPDLLVRQITSPVRWTDTVRRMIELGATDVVEVGPGAVLTRLVGRIESGLQRFAMGTRDEVFRCHRTLSGVRRRSLVDAGWVRRGRVLVSPDRRQIITEHEHLLDADGSGVGTGGPVSESEANAGS